MAGKASDGFDYVIVGAGAAGCVIANRLSADPAIRVALIEAGPSDRRFPVNLKTAVPIGNILLLPHARYNWQFTFGGGPGVGNRTITCPRGKMFGGCTSLNGSVYIRGNHADYDEWAALGNEGWAYDDVLPVFRRHENRQGGASEFHGAGGELDVVMPKSHNPLSHAFVEAAVQAGHRRSDDFNGALQDGYGLYEVNQRNGVRLSASRAFLHSVLDRPNLTVYADTLVERIEFSGLRATGVSVVQDGQRRTIAASCEVILSGGAINSPQVLMLSGVGASKDLGRHGVRTVAELPGVGQNLQDHPTVYLSNADPQRMSYALSWKSAPRMLFSPLQYIFGRTGMIASNVAEAGGFVRTLPELERPDVQMTFLTGLKSNARTIPRNHGFMVLVQLLRPKSRGRIDLASADPADKPILTPRFLEPREDVDTLVRGLREARRIFASPALARFGGAEIEPGAKVTDDIDLESFIRRQVNTAYHPTSTCSMGPADNPMAVVDSKLRVHGVEGLRVADASIMPTIIGGNTAAPSMMIGERVADFILSDARAVASDRTAA